jgi:hypothetical protein
MAAVALCALAPGPDAAGDDAARALRLEQVLDAFAAHKRIDARFEERKDLAALERPLHSRGLLRYRAPSRMEKQTLEPQPESFAVDGDWLDRYTEGGGWERHYLPSQPLIAALMAAVQGVLAGDAAVLARYYHVSVEGAPQAWRIVLRPREDGLAELVDAIALDGSGGSLARVETAETGGDTTVMTISDWRAE